MHARHRKIDPIEHLHILLCSPRQQVDVARVKWTSGNQVSGYQMINVFVVVLDRFYAEEGRSQNHRQDQADN